jgi:hypothetical protein
MGNVTVSKDYLMNPAVVHNFRKLFLGKNGDPLGIEGPGQFRGEDSVFNAGNLGSGESDYFYGWIIAVTNLEIMKIPSRRAHDEDFGSVHHNLQ